MRSFHSTATPDSITAPAITLYIRAKSQILAIGTAARGMISTGLSTPNLSASAQATTAQPTIATTPQGQAQAESQAQAQPPLPPAQLFDILPPLHELLSRLEPTLNEYTGTNPTGDGSDAISGSGSNGSEPLSYKEVATASQFLKARMRKALAELGKLGDMDRTVEEQEEEIAALERRVGRQRGVLARLGEMAREMERLREGGGGGESG